MEVARCVFDLEYQYSSNCIFLFKNCWTIGSHCHQKHSFPSSLSDLRFDFNLITSFILSSKNLCQKSQVDIFRTFEYKFSFLLCLVLDNRQLYHSKTIFTDQLLAATNEGCNSLLFENQLNGIFNSLDTE